MTLQVLALAADRFGDRSLSYPYYRLQEAGHSVDIASPDGGPVTGLHGVDFEADSPISAVEGADYDLLVLPGGYSSEAIRMQAPEAIDIVRAFDERGKPIASVCHGAQLLVSAGVVDGRRLACHPSIKDDIEAAGGTFVNDAGVVDGNLITARDYSDVAEWLAAVLDVVETATDGGAVASSPEPTRSTGSTFQPIGTIHSPYSEESGMPIQGAFSDAMGVVDLDEAYVDGLLDIEGFSHLVLLYQFHAAESYDLQPQPFMEDTTHGVFATRAPRRPNPIGMSVVELENVSDGTLFVSGIDVLDGTPLLDIKPYVPDFNGVESARIGWLEDSIENERRRTADDRFLD
ncbi:tRNA (N6-threonylcarbamoyladenosine(37)-N6)-methyltransferase TrmO [Halodesulfurarchaeum sp. HSR-GB]|uniref:tRNA (N6-threonylcarbamoyladenosine(37)-N6)-methyltransferase TrmO n=1 Tax=Halodesulfurarchaeum sp. HSR-GB TaxID=3074077 RepID=UPI00285E4977|nr:tRNA (N6-threonylcarbamoyladenosine(37)-N6)-methyltransferase TrmO [Halodesulfurarchaeum sp. HSR-GB]MDR5657325.1 tRNA (N6-threonylcarbamoyladenosine(37)-N6)-methyltransferase TrmO [Halodesulfurarchaeum sp. HSR-GB]